LGETQAGGVVLADDCSMCVLFTFPCSKYVTISVLYALMGLKTKVFVWKTRLVWLVVD